MNNIPNKIEKRINCQMANLKYTKICKIKLHIINHGTLEIEMDFYVIWR